MVRGRRRCPSTRASPCRGSERTAHGPRTTRVVVSRRAGCRGPEGCGHSRRRIRWRPAVDLGSPRSADRAHPRPGRGQGRPADGGGARVDRRVADLIGVGGGSRCRRGRCRARALFRAAVRPPGSGCAQRAGGPRRHRAGGVRTTGRRADRDDLGRRFEPAQLSRRRNRPRRSRPDDIGAVGRWSGNRRTEHRAQAPEPRRRGSPGCSRRM